MVTGCTAAPSTTPQATVNWACVSEAVTSQFRLGTVTYDSVGVVPLKLASPYGTIKTLIPVDVCGPYELKDGDSNYLPVGTDVYRVEGYEPSFRLGVPQNEDIELYEVTHNSAALSGRDLYDIEGKVDFVKVTIEDGTGRTKSKILAYSEDKEVVLEIVRGLMDAKAAARFDQVEYDDLVYTIHFGLADGTLTTCWYAVNKNLLQHGLTPSGGFDVIFLALLQRP